MPGQPTKSNPRKRPSPAARPATADRRRASSGAAAPTPASSPSKLEADDPMKQRSHWRLIVALLILPLLAGTATLYRVGFRFQATGQFAINQAAQGSDALIRPSAPIDEYRLALIDSAWNCGQQADRPDRKPVEWDVHAGRNPHELMLTAVACSPIEAEGFVQTVAQAFQRRLQSLADRSALEMDQEVKPLIDWRGDIDTMLASLPAADSTEKAAERAGLPIDRMSETWDLLDAQRTDLQQIRWRLAESVNQRAEIVAAPPPEAVAVDPTVRQQAYDQHVALQEDLRHLKLQLLQVRRAMQNVWQKATPSLDEAVNVAQRLAGVTQMRESATWQGEARARLERVTEAAGDFARVADAFRDDWTRDFTRVDALTVEPQAERPPLLILHEKISDRAAEYLHEAELLLAKIRVRMRSLEQLSEDRNANPVMQAEAAKSIRSLEGAQQRFALAVAELTSRDNYLLDAALHSALGLLQRTRDARHVIDQTLEEQARQQLVNTRNQKIRDLDKRIESLRADERDRVANLLELQDNLKSEMDRIPEYMNWMLTKSESQTRRDLLMRHREGIERLIASRRSAERPAVNPADMKLRSTSSEKRPVNLRNVASLGLLAWSLTFLGLLGGHRLLFRSRRPGNLRGLQQVR